MSKPSRWSLLVYLGPIFLSCAVPGALPDVDTYLDTRWDTPGWAQHFFMAGESVYICDGTEGLRVIVPGRSQTSCDTPGFARAAAIYGDLVCVADTDGGLQIINVSNPRAPFIRTAIPAAGPAMDVAIAGPYAYVAVGSVGLQSFYLLNNSRAVGLCDTPGSAVSVAMRDNLAFVACRSGGLQVVDTTNPFNLQIVGASMDCRDARSVSLSGTLAIVADGNNGLVILNITNPRQPALKGRYQTEGFCSDAVGVPDRVYLASSMMEILDITKPENPRRIGSHYMVPTHISKSSAWESGIYIARGEFGTYQLTTTEAIPQRFATHKTARFAMDLAVNETHAFIADETFGIDVVDLSQMPVVNSIAARFIGEAPRGMALSSNYLYASSGSRISVFNLQDPSAPLSAGFVFVPDSDLRDLVASGRYLYAADYQNGLHIFDLEDPRKPRLAGSHLSPFSLPESVAVSGSYAYLADFEGVKIIDVANPAQPALVSSYRGTGNYLACRGVAVKGKYAYVAAGRSGLHVVDLTDPLNPRGVGYYQTTGDAVSVAINLPALYLADTLAGLITLDLSNPESPTKIGGNTAIEPESLEVAGGYLFTAAGTAGLALFRLVQPQVVFESRDTRYTAEGYSFPVWGTFGEGTATSMLQRSEDLVNWENWQIIYAGIGTFEIVDPDAKTRPRYFYRAVAPTE